MRDKIEQIKNLLAELESAAGDEESQQFTKSYNALELPSIVSSVVGFLHPLLTPYEIAAAQLFFCKNFQATASGWKSQSFRLR